MTELIVGLAIFSLCLNVAYLCFSLHDAFLVRKLRKNLEKRNRELEKAWLVARLVGKSYERKMNEKTRWN